MTRTTILRASLVLFVTLALLSVHVMAEPKQEWPELLGKTGEEAQAVIKRERPELNVSLLGENMPATMDYRVDRVRIIVNDQGKVVMKPMTG